MTESMDKVHGITELPLFPLPLVLFPGVPLPLHIFEQRYRQMLKDISAGNKLFGLSYFDSSLSSEDVPAVGHIGCVAELTEMQALPDGRSNILTMGVIRYRMEGYVHGELPYLVARVRFFEDEEEDLHLVTEISQEVGTLFTRIAGAVRKISDERANLPDISETDPQTLSFLVAAALEIEPEQKQELLELSLASERLIRLREMLRRAVGSYEERARIHELAKGNGHSGNRIEME